MCIPSEVVERHDEEDRKRLDTAAVVLNGVMMEVL